MHRGAWNRPLYGANHYIQNAQPQQQPRVPPPIPARRGRMRRSLSLTAIPDLRNAVDTMLSSQANGALSNTATHSKQQAQAAASPVQTIRSKNATNTAKVVSSSSSSPSSSPTTTSTTTNGSPPPTITSSPLSPPVPKRPPRPVSRRQPSASSPSSPSFPSASSSSSSSVPSMNAPSAPATSPSTATANRGRGGATARGKLWRGRGGLASPSSYAPPPATAPAALSSPQNTSSSTSTSYLVVPSALTQLSDALEEKEEKEEKDLTATPTSSLWPTTPSRSSMTNKQSIYSPIASEPTSVRQVDLADPCMFLCWKWGRGVYRGHRGTKIKKFKEKEQCLLFLDGTGIHILNHDSGETEQYFSFAQIKNWAYSTEIFSFICAEEGAESQDELLAYDFKTNKAFDIYEKLAYQKAQKLREIYKSKSSSSSTSPSSPSIYRPIRVSTTPSPSASPTKANVDAPSSTSSTGRLATLSKASSIGSMSRLIPSTITKSETATTNTSEERRRRRTEQEEHRRGRDKHRNNNDHKHKKRSKSADQVKHRNTIRREQHQQQHQQQRQHHRKTQKSYLPSRNNKTQHPPSSVATPLTSVGVKSTDALRTIRLHNKNDNNSTTPTSSPTASPSKLRRRAPSADTVNQNNNISNVKDEMEKRSSYGATMKRSYSSRPQVTAPIHAIHKLHISPAQAREGYATLKEHMQQQPEYSDASSSASSGESYTSHYSSSSSMLVPSSSTLRSRKQQQKQQQQEREPQQQAQHNSTKDEPQKQESSGVTIDLSFNKTVHVNKDEAVDRINNEESAANAEQQQKEKEKEEREEEKDSTSPREKKTPPVVPPRHHDAAAALSKSSSSVTTASLSKATGSQITPSTSAQNVSVGGSLSLGPKSGKKALLQRKESSENVAGSQMTARSGKKRMAVVNELVTTERDYNRDLDIMVDIYMKTMKESGIVSSVDLLIIFSNVDQLRNLNKALLSSLDGLQETPIEQQDVGKRFLDFIAFLKLYTQYCSNQTRAQLRLQELKREKQDLIVLLEGIRQRPECNRLDLQSYLIKPLQRVTKYPLLFRELLKITPEWHEDWKSLNECYNNLLEVVEVLDQQKLESENLVKMMQLQQKFESSKQPLKLVEASRKYITEGNFRKVLKGNSLIPNCTVILFNDSLLLAVKKLSKKQDKEERYIAKSDRIPLYGVLVWDERNYAQEFGFSVVNREVNQEKITIFAASQTEKEEWVDLINATLASLPNALKSQQGVAVEKFSRTK
ncbi:Intersectin-2 [Balamuthia mandrillaris]